MGGSCGPAVDIFKKGWRGLVLPWQVVKLGMGRWWWPARAQVLGKLEAVTSPVFSVVWAGLLTQPMTAPTISPNPHLTHEETS